MIKRYAAISPNYKVLLSQVFPVKRFPMRQESRSHAKVWYLADKDTSSRASLMAGVQTLGKVPVG